MKRIWIAFVLIGVVISACIWGQITIKNAYNELTGSFNKIIDLCEKENYEKALEYNEKLLSQWNKYFPSLSAIKNHDDLHDLMIDINMINKHIKNKDMEKIEEICDDALIRLEHIKDGEKISFGNVF